MGDPMKNPKVYFTLNNYVPNTVRGVAYYAIDAVGDPLHLTVDQWRNAAHVRDHVIGQQMYLHSNNNGANFNLTFRTPGHLNKYL